MAQQGFRRHDHQRLAEITPQLASQHMEVIRRGRTVHDLHIILGAELQIAFKTRR